jgi:hypothetical protein
LEHVNNGLEYEEAATVMVLQLIGMSTYDKLDYFASICNIDGRLKKNGDIVRQSAFSWRHGAPAQSGGKCRNVCERLCIACSNSNACLRIRSLHLQNAVFALAFASAASLCTERLRFYCEQQ